MEDRDYQTRRWRSERDDGTAGSGRPDHFHFRRDVESGNSSGEYQRSPDASGAPVGGRTRGPFSPHGVPNFKIQPGSERLTTIGGAQAVRAIGEYELGGQKITELLAWICTEHTRTYFFAKLLTDDLPALQFPFDELLQSARIP
jgi:hypothetical protein